MIGRLAAFWHGCPAGLKEAYASFAVQSLIALAYSLNRYIGHAASRPGIRRFVPWAVLNLTATFVVHLACLRALSPDYHRSISVTGFPTARGFVLEVLGSLLVFEVLFYYIHRLMHTRLFYRPVHAMHHRMTDKVCLGAFYVHPVEFLMVGFGAFMGAVALTRTHFSTMLFLGVVAELAGLYFHELGEVSGVMSHESHHVRGAKNFGSIGLMDVLHGTFMKTLFVPVVRRESIVLPFTDLPKIRTTVVFKTCQGFSYSCSVRRMSLRARLGFR
ncbi:C-4 methylsterol oxidase [Metarhizium anisopliae]|nr:C-4 methylsterol oxidase [Metarhizium anisopliae]